MKRTLFILVVLTFSTCAFAQFEKGTKYVGVNFSGLGASYSGSEKFRIGVGAQAGYFFMDALAAVATINWDKNVDGAPAISQWEPKGVIIFARMESSWVQVLNISIVAKAITISCQM